MNHVFINTVISQGGTYRILPKINHEEDPKFPLSFLPIYSPLQTIPVYMLLADETSGCSDAAMAAVLAYVINKPDEKTQDIDDVISELLLSMSMKTAVNISRLLSGIIIIILHAWLEFGR